MWGSQQSRPMTATGMSAAATSDPDGDGYSRTQRHPVPLDAPNVALQGQRLMAYGERLRREEEQITQESGRARPTASTPDGTAGPRGKSEENLLRNAGEFFSLDNRGPNLKCIGSRGSTRDWPTALGHRGPTSASMPRPSTAGHAPTPVCGGASV